MPATSRQMVAKLSKHGCSLAVVASLDRIGRDADQFFDRRAPDSRKPQPCDSAARPACVE